MWKASNAPSICHVVLSTAAAIAPSKMCKVKLSGWRLVKMSEADGAAPGTEPEPYKFTQLIL